MLQGNFSSSRSRTLSIVLHYGDPALAAQCVRSLIGSGLAPRDVLVVDNGSPWPYEVTCGEELVRRDTNGGFAVGMNTGITVARERNYEFVWLLNSDTEPGMPLLNQLEEVLDNSPRVALCSPLITTLDGKHVTFAGATWDAWRGSARHLLVPQTDEPYTSEFVTATAPLVRLHPEAVAAALPRDLFLYYEDVEWSLHLRRAGWDLLVDPRARLRHAVASSSGGHWHPHVQYYNLRNRLIVSRRTSGRAQHLVATAFLLLWLVKHWGDGGPDARRGRHRGLWDGLRGKSGAWRD